MNENNKTSVSSARIVLFGSEGGYSRAVLGQLMAQGLYVAAVVITENSAGKGQFPIDVKQPVKPGSLVEMASKNKVDLLRTNNLSDDSFIHQLNVQRADIFLVACFAKIIPTCIWKQMNVPCWNLHPSLLPKYRGPSPIVWQIKNRESETGLTLHEICDRIDAGDIVARESISLPSNADDVLLDDWVAEHGVKLFCKALDQYLCGKLKPEPQDELQASYFPAWETGVKGTTE